MNEKSENKGRTKILGFSRTLTLHSHSKKIIKGESYPTPIQFLVELQMY